MAPTNLGFSLLLSLLFVVASADYVTPPPPPPPPAAPETYKPPSHTKPQAPSPPAKSYTPPPLASAPPVKPYLPSPKSPSPPGIKRPSPLPYYGRGPLVKKQECLPLCKKRCALHSRMSVCIRACSTCCYRCKCVPPGTYGNKEVCGRCYTDMTTHGGRPKCP